MLVVVTVLGLIVTVGYDCGCVSGGLNFFPPLLWAMVATWRLLLVKWWWRWLWLVERFLVDILYFIFYFNEFFILF